MRGVRHRAKIFGAPAARQVCERGATELASEFLNCTEKLARFQLVIFYFKVSKSKDFRCSRIGGVQGAGAGPGGSDTHKRRSSGHKLTLGTGVWCLVAFSSDALRTRGASRE